MSSSTLATLQPRRLAPAPPVRQLEATSDRDLRSALLKRLTTSLSQPRIVEEMVIAGEARVDVATLGDHLHGFEIKSHRDTLRRLPAQIDVYSRVFDYVTLVVDTHHLSAAQHLVPSWWGVTEARPGRAGVRLVQRSRGRRNTALDATYLVTLLWRDEALSVLTEFGLDRGLRSKSGLELRRALVENLSTKALRDAVLDRLRVRQGWRPAAS